MKRVKKSPPLPDHVFRRAMREDMRIEQGQRCCYCSTPMARQEVTFEHRRPKSKGGTDARTNAAAACETCNFAKGDMSEKEFRHVIRDADFKRAAALWLAGFRYRVNKQTDAACRRIERFAA